MQHTRPWHARRGVQGMAALALGALLVLVLVLTGPRPVVKGDLLTDAPTDAMATAATLRDGGSVETVGGAQGASGAASASGSLVTVDFYGESLCPDCQHMVLDVLLPMFDDGTAELMHLTYHAFGNVKNNSDGTFSHQHGSAEGKFNRYLLCAQRFHPKQADWFPYVRCFADNMHALDSNADQCATDLSWEAEELSSCATGDLGTKLELEAAAATWALKPKHTFVPWIVVNGAALGGDFENLERYVCSAAPATSRPEACNQLPAHL